jgi:hypothetical protein
MPSQTLIDYLGKSPNYEFMYHQTNESVEAITTALDVKGSDQVISICASGAQPLALLENLSNKGKLLAIDINPDQITWVKAVLEVFKNKDRKEIAELNLAPRDQEYGKADYFLRGNRLKKINANLDRINFKIKDTYKELNLRKKFTKGYFSNVQFPLQLVNNVFESWALVYMTYASPYLPNRPLDFLKNCHERYGENFDTYFTLDIEKTKVACDIEKKYPSAGWTPAVFRRK